MSAAPEVISAALKYIERDWHIVAARDKKPLDKNWRRPFSKQEIIDRLQGQCDGFGFLGGNLNNGIVPLDFDTEAGEAWWQKQCEAAGIPADDFPTVITPGKIKDGKRTPGRHRYVSDTRGALGNAEGELKRLGINVRGNGHAMLPPSPHPHGGTYRWLDGHSLDDFDVIPACPDFVYAAIEAGQHKTQTPTTTTTTADDSAWRYCRTALSNEIIALARTASSRNNQLNDASLKLGSLAHYRAFTEGEVLAALRDACEQNGLVGDDGVRAFEATFQSGWKAGLESPRTIEPRRERPRANGADEAQAATIESIEDHRRIGAVETTPWWERCVKGETGKPLPVVANAIIALETMFRAHFSFDEMARMPMLLQPFPRLLDGDEAFPPRPVTDTDITVLQERLQHLGLKRIATETVHQAVDVRAHACRFHPVRDYLAGLKWDGKPRLREFMPVYFGTEATAYTAAIGVYLLECG